MILLDTHALIWWVADPARVPAKATRAIGAAQRAGELFSVSSISIWEIVMLTQRVRLTLTVDVDAWLAKLESLAFLEFHPVDNRVAQRSARLDDLDTRDPADRMIVATAILTGATVVTADTRMHSYRLLKSVWD